MINLDNIKTALGEGIFLERLSDRLFWVDINKSMLFSYVNGQIDNYQVPENISTVLFAKDNLVYLTNRSGVISYNLFSNNICQISKTPIQYSSKAYRANDGIKLDDKLYMYGVMRNNPIKNDGALILSRDGVSKIIYSEISIPNTFIKIPNSNSLLITDSFSGKIQKIIFSKSWSSIQSKEEWFDLRHTEITPDGGCISSNGRIFIAIWNGFKIIELDVDGNIVDEFKIPIPRPTNCALNVKEDKLFVTSAYEGLSSNERKQYPLSGSIIEIDVRNKRC